MLPRSSFNICTMIDYNGMYGRTIDYVRDLAVLTPCSLQRKFRFLTQCQHYQGVICIIFAFLPELKGKQSPSW